MRHRFPKCLFQNLIKSRMKSWLWTNSHEHCWRQRVHWRLQACWTWVCIVHGLFPGIVHSFNSWTWIATGSTNTISTCGYESILQQTYIPKHSFNVTALYLNNCWMEKKNGTSITHIQFWRLQMLIKWNDFFFLN